MWLELLFNLKRLPCCYSFSYTCFVTLGDPVYAYSQYVHVYTVSRPHLYSRLIASLVHPLTYDHLSVWYPCIPVNATSVYARANQVYICQWMYRTFLDSLRILLVRLWTFLSSTQVFFSIRSIIFTCRSTELQIPSLAQYTPMYYQDAPSLPSWDPSGQSGGL